MLLPALACAEPPERPTFERDVAPILFARCVRCHREVPPQAGGIAPIPNYFRLDVYETESGLSMGARAMAVMNAHRVSLPADDPLIMPPKPSLPLTDLQRETLERWGLDPVER